MIILGIDIDDVCADFMTAIINKYGMPIKWDRYSLMTMYPKNLHKAIYKDVANYRIYKKLAPIPGAAETITAIRETGLVQIHPPNKRSER